MPAFCAIRARPTMATSAHGWQESHLALVPAGMSRGRGLCDVQDDPPGSGRHSDPGTGQRPPVITHAATRQQSMESEVYMITMHLVGEVHTTSTIGIDRSTDFITAEVTGGF